MIFVVIKRIMSCNQCSDFSIYDDFTFCPKCGKQIQFVKQTLNELDVILNESTLWSKALIIDNYMISVTYKMRYEVRDHDQDQMYEQMYFTGIVSFHKEIFRFSV